MIQRPGPNPDETTPGGASDRELLLWHLDGLLTEAQAQELSRRLRARPELVHQLAGMVQLEEQLIGLIAEQQNIDQGEWLLHLASLEPDPVSIQLVELTEQQTYTPPRRPAARPQSPVNRVLVIPKSLAYGGLAAAVILLALLIYQFGLGAGQSTPTRLAEHTDSPTTDLTVASLAWLSENAVLHGTDGTPAPRDRLVPGRYQIESGEAMIRFDTGTEVTLSAPASFEIIGLSLTQLHDGRLHAEVPPAGHGFKVAVPGGVVTDLGTAFRVHVDRANHTTQVEVSRGLVEISPSAGRVDGPVRLGARQFADLSGDGTSLIAYERTPKRVDLAVFNTGLAKPGTPPLMHQAPDTHWTIVDEQGQAGPAFVIAPSVLRQTTEIYWVASDARTSQWLAPSIDALQPEDNRTYTYRTSFEVSDAIDPATLQFTGRFIADDQLISVRLNGQEIGGPYQRPFIDAGPQDRRRFTSWTPIDLEAPEHALTAGENTLEFVVRNSTGHTGLRLELNLSAIRLYQPLSPE